MGFLNTKTSAHRRSQSAERAVERSSHPATISEAPKSPPIAQSRELRPNPARAGLVIFKPGWPFSHYCEVCGAWGSFGFGHLDFRTGKLGRWFCFEHKPESLR